MHIIMGKEAAEALKENYTVLELETFHHNGQDITAFCVVDQVPIMELPALESYKQQHKDFIECTLPNITNITGNCTNPLCYLNGSKVLEKYAIEPV